MNAYDQSLVEEISAASLVAMQETDLEKRKKQGHRLTNILLHWELAEETELVKALVAKDTAHAYFSHSITVVLDDKFKNLAIETLEHRFMWIKVSVLCIDKENGTFVFLRENLLRKCVEAEEQIGRLRMTLVANGDNMLIFLPSLIGADHVVSVCVAK